MTDSNSDLDTRVAAFAEQFGFSQAAVHHLLDAVSQGGGDMAMFDHPEFRGPGQWMRGGLIMTTDPSDHLLKNRIEALCNALSDMLRQAHSSALAGHRRINPNARAWDTVAFARERWWPADLGEPAATGEQNELAYAYFDDARRLAIRRDGQVAVYDTGQHRITGTAQSQAGSSSRVVFTSQLGEVRLDSLTRRDTTHEQAEAASESPQPTDTSSRNSAEILEAIERLGDLHHQGVLTESEFTSKKRELLERL